MLNEPPKSELFQTDEAREAFAAIKGGEAFEALQAQIQPVLTVADVTAPVHESNQASALILDPVALIGGELGKAIATRAERLQVPSSVLMNGVFPSAASQMPNATRVLLNPDTEFVQPSVIWSLSVAPTGSNKSETSDIAVRPLHRFQDDVPEGEERHYFTSSFTLSGLTRVQAAQPERGCLINPDELSGFVRKIQSDQNRGTSDELSRLLSIYDGRPLRGNFSDKTLNYNLKRSSFSLLSTIQPSVLLDCMGNLDDESGLWARFNLCEIPLRKRVMERTGRKPDGLMPLLQEAYQNLQKWTPRTHELSVEAQDLFFAYYDACEERRVDENLQSALRAYAGKQEGRCGRIALVLHCLKAATVGVAPAVQIDAETMQGAIDVCHFYEQQLKRFYTLALAQVGESLEGDVVNVFEYIKNRQGKVCTIRLINKGPRALRRMTTIQIQKALVLLEGQNLIKRNGDGWVLVVL